MLAAIGQAALAPPITVTTSGSASFTRRAIAAQASVCWNVVDTPRMRGRSATIRATMASSAAAT